ncbi:hypothetical protein GXW83_27390 [Streptacidiphilus sp. PB12-B1b]|uniref:hypothetical protein n=1 Tax=Streptacidiphilus sp. PB12-B1b TaxID=2705012 RepID=UPI0015F78973|nr:hypothetical protein [Streptacidiphilus sp. PB12-B1b]QMU78870.1 hypothetical protein GXW83_27390 [Streptacidiphilus sp. PB12-B1b]
MTDTDDTRDVDPDTWFERLYADDSATEDTKGLATTETPAVDQADPEPEPETDADDDQAEAAEPPFDLRALADHLAGVLSETPAEREQRRQREHEARLAAAGETAAERRQRHREERRKRERLASLLPLVHHTERVRRFRRWVILTGLSASVGYSVHLVQATARQSPTVGGALLGGFWLLDLYIRRWGRVRVSQVRGAFPLALLIIVRIPVASALVALLGLAPLLALTGHH